MSGDILIDTTAYDTHIAAGGDFPADTKDIVRRFLAGEYPQRRSET